MKKLLAILGALIICSNMATVNTYAASASGYIYFTASESYECILTSVMQNRPDAKTVGPENGRHCSISMWGQCENFAFAPADCEIGAQGRYIELVRPNHGRLLNATSAHYVDNKEKRLYLNF